MFEIIANLYLSAFQAVDVSLPNTFIVNCTKDLPMKSDRNIRIAVHDDMSKEAIDTMFMALHNVVEQIHEELQKGRRVIVHCLAGQQRSPTVIAAYLVAKCGYSLPDAIHYIRSKKKDAFFWSINFRDALERFVMMHGYFP